MVHHCRSTDGIKARESGSKKGRERTNQVRPGVFCPIIESIAEAFARIGFQVVPVSDQRRKADFKNTKEKLREASLAK